MKNIIQILLYSLAYFLIDNWKIYLGVLIFVFTYYIQVIRPDIIKRKLKKDFYNG